MHQIVRPHVVSSSSLSRFMHIKKKSWDAFYLVQIYVQIPVKAGTCSAEVNLLILGKYSDHV